MMSKVEQFRGMTREQFMGEYRVIPNRSNMNSVYVPAKLKDAPREPFMGRFTASFDGSNSAVVYDGERPIAVITVERRHYAAVLPEYRGQGIGEEIVYRFVTERGHVTPGVTRTAGLQRVYEKVWARIQAELNA